MKTWLKRFLSSERGENIIRVGYTLIIIFFILVLLQPVYSKSIEKENINIISDMNYYVITQDTLDMYNYTTNELFEYINNNSVCNAVWLNEDKIYIGLTPEQKELWLKNIEKAIKQEIKVQKEQGTEIIVDEEYQNLKVYSCNDIRKIVFLCRTYQQIKHSPIQINIKIY